MTSKDRRRKGTGRKLVRDSRKGDGKATLRLAWKICKVLIAFYNYLGDGRLSYPIHSRATLVHHPLLCFLAPSALLSWGFFFLAFSFSLSLSLPLFLLRTWFPRSCPFVTLSLSLPRTLTRGLRFLSHQLPEIRVCVPPLARTFSCVYTWTSKEIVVRASCTSYTELRNSAIYFDIKNDCSFPDFS